MWRSLHRGQKVKTKPYSPWRFGELDLDVHNVSRGIGGNLVVILLHTLGEAVEAVLSWLPLTRQYPTKNYL